MLEIEVKCPVHDLMIIEKLLKSKGATFGEELHQADIYMGHPCRDFGRTDEALRLRRENDRWILFYKGPKVDPTSKTREELSTPIPDPESLIIILQRVGFTEVMRVQKVRRVYLFKEVEVCLDHVEGLGNFVEMEVQDLELEAGKKLIRAVMDELGLEKTERSSYLELLLKNRVKD
jgi:adenylate cyclase class 2